MAGLFSGKKGTGDGLLSMFGMNNPLADYRGMMMGLGAGMLSNNPSAAALYAMQGMQADQSGRKERKTEDLQNQYAQSITDQKLRQLFQLNPEAYVKGQIEQSVGGNEYGLTPVYGTGPDGKPSIVQLGKNGKPVQPQLPEGFNIARDPVKVEGPTGTSILDPQTRQVIQVIPKDVAGAASQQEIGQKQGAAMVDLPKVRQSAETIRGYIKAIKDDPYLPNMTGPIQGRLPNLTGAANTLQARIEQLKGGAFLAAFETLKGGGQISNIEGAKAEQAKARLANMNQDDAGYLEALNDLEREVSSLVTLAEQRAGGAPMQQPQVAPANNALKHKYGLE